MNPALFGIYEVEGGEFPSLILVWFNDSSDVLRKLSQVVP